MKDVRNLLALLVLLLLTGCSSYTQAHYSGNYPIGTFKAKIGNETFLTNGKDIREVSNKITVDLDYCFSTDNDVICSYGFDIKVSDQASERFTKDRQEFVRSGA